MKLQHRLLRLLPLLVLTAAFALFDPCATAADTASSQVTLTVPASDTGNGVQISNQGRENAGSSSSVESKTKGPETGDEALTGILFYSGMALLAAAGVCLLFEKISYKKKVSNSGGSLKIR